MRLSTRLFTVVTVSTLILAAAGAYPTAQGAPDAPPAPAAATNEARRKPSAQPTAKLVKKAGGIKDKYIVVLADHAAGETGADSRAEEVAEHLIATHGGKLSRKFKHALNGFSATLTEAQALSMSLDPAVAFVEQQNYGTVQATQSSAPWGLDRADQRPLPLNGGFTYNYTGYGVTVYVLDTGIRTSHTDFGGRASVAVDTIRDGRNGQDCGGHGTHVAASIAGARYGVAKSALVRSVRVIDCNNRVTQEQAVEGIEWVTRYHRKPAVANMSLGFYPASASVDAAVNRSVLAGVTYVVAAGNSNIDARYVSPARAEYALTVGAVNRYDSRASGTGWASNYGPWVDVFAPGQDILSADFRTTSGGITMSGTSMAAPHVAGAAAAYLHFYPAATPFQVRDIIIRTSTANVLRNLGTGSYNRLLFSRLHY